MPVAPPDDGRKAQHQEAGTKNHGAREPRVCLAGFGGWHQLPLDLFLLLLLMMMAAAPPAPMIKAGIMLEVPTAAATATGPPTGVT
ncbi:MAG: hypothetical protein KA141_10945, partial [Rubrivivax sp.]|nr:hypothetical protein [Rubrivivax sp.]